MFGEELYNKNWDIKTKLLHEQNFIVPKGARWKYYTAGVFTGIVLTLAFFLAAGVIG